MQTNLSRHRRSIQALGLTILNLLAGTVTAQTCLAPPPGAIAWYPAERHADDAIGFFNGTRAGGMAFGPGAVGEAFVLDGVDDSVTTSVLVQEMRSVRTFSYEMWARPTAVLGNCPQSNNSNCGGANLPWADFPFHGDTGAPAGEQGMAAGIGIAIGTTGVCVGEHAAFLVDCLARVNTAINDWTHVVTVVENKTPRIYLNGVLVHTGIASAKSFVFASWEVLGSGLGLGRYAGELDEVTIYDRALSDAEIAALFAAGANGKCPTACPVERNDDAWQQPQVLSTSGLLSTDASGMFGGQAAFPEPTSTLFADGQPVGTVHTIEWEILAPILLDGFGLAAFHDGIANTQRAFREFKLEARPIGGSFVTVYNSPIVTPYAPGSRDLVHCVNLRPTQVQQFRASFTQHGAPGFSGPRVLELDATALAELLFADSFENP